MNMQQVGHESLEAFVRTTQEVITGEPFDSILAASDSGQLAAHITNIVYTTLDLAPPPTFVAPIFRHVDKARTVIFDNSQQADSFLEWRGYDFKKSLFTDDEIWRGNTLKGMLDLVMALNAQIADLTVIAEDGGFVHDDDIRGIPLRYIPPKPRMQEIYNAFSYAVPDKYYWPLKQALADEPDINHKQVMCTLLGLPVKDRLQGMPFFSTRLLGKAATSLVDFTSHQRAFCGWLSQTVQGYMNE